MSNIEKVTKIIAITNRYVAPELFYSCLSAFTGGLVGGAVAKVVYNAALKNHDEPDTKDKIRAGAASVPIGIAAGSVATASVLVAENIINCGFVTNAATIEAGVKAIKEVIR